jgi:cytoskeletal protein CcmA (bactofilin family)
MKFRKNSPTASVPATTSKYNKKEVSPSILTQDVNLLGNIVSEGNIDFDGTLNGNIRCSTLTIRGNGYIKGEVVANNVIVYGKIKGLIRAKNVQLCSTCNVEGIVMHETISIEDGAFIDGKCKRSDKVQTSDEDDNESNDFAFEDASADLKVLENIRLIR